MPYAAEAVTTMISLIEGEYRGKLIVILAGYKDDLERAFLANQGLSRRFKKVVVDFENWTPQSEQGRELGGLGGDFENWTPQSKQGRELGGGGGP
jgi:hypothetical protein